MPSFYSPPSHRSRYRAVLHNIAALLSLAYPFIQRKLRMTLLYVDRTHPLPPGNLVERPRWSPDSLGKQT
ncbi:hypothetical protein LZ32DRAFT_609449 [Colletotrichum eremochloae]|nr:hypothetical protein LZ32DRAFT_609449 [Colletotrichum eremochloae]